MWRRRINRQVHESACTKYAPFGKIDAFQSNTPKRMYVRVYSRVYTGLCTYIRFYPSPRSFVHLFCGSQRGTKWRDRFEVQHESKQKYFFCALIRVETSMSQYIYTAIQWNEDTVKRSKFKFHRDKAGGKSEIL